MSVEKLAMRLPPIDWWEIPEVCPGCGCTEADACLVNAGRGRLQKEADILRALEDGALKEASLDVFEREPLPEDSPLWTHPRVFLTPHAAATSDPIHLVPPMLEQMARFERGEPLENLVDRNAGY